MLRASKGMGKERQTLRLLESHKAKTASSHCLILDETSLQEDDYKNNHCPKEADGRGIPHLAKEERLLIEVENARERAVGGSTARHDIGFDEKREAPDGRKYTHKHDRWIEHRNCDQSKFLPGTRAVEFRRFVQLGGNRLQSDQKEHHVEANVLPGGHDCNRGHRVAT